MKSSSHLNSRRASPSSCLGHHLLHLSSSQAAQISSLSLSSPLYISFFFCILCFVLVKILAQTQTIPFTSSSPNVPFCTFGTLWYTYQYRSIIIVIIVECLMQPHSHSRCIFNVCARSSFSSFLDFCELSFVLCIFNGVSEYMYLCFYNSRLDKQLNESVINMHVSFPNAQVVTESETSGPHW